LFVVWLHLRLVVLEIDVSALWVNWWLVAITLSSNGNRIVNSLRLFAAELSLNILTVTIVIKLDFRWMTINFWFGNHLINFAHLSFEFTQNIDSLIINIVLFDCWQVSEDSRGSNPSFSGHFTDETFWARK
jgi:hypothetical protein